VSASAWSRPIVSAAPPAANGTTRRTGLLGHSAAKAPADDRTLAVAAGKRTAVGFMLDTPAPLRPPSLRGAEAPVPQGGGGPSLRGGGAWGGGHALARA